ncbi:MAG: hypothetical protein HFG55_07635 [Lachnospiraceae bacterium]|nr:hypothetical protein [Lachnospiraceae bacterium]
MEKGVGSRSNVIKFSSENTQPWKKEREATEKAADHFSVASRSFFHGVPFEKINLMTLEAEVLIFMRELQNKSPVISLSCVRTVHVHSLLLTDKVRQYQTECS